MKARQRRRTGETLQTAAMCSICCETSFRYYGQLECGHNAFCLPCIATWASTTNKCPLCGHRFRVIAKCKWQDGGITPTGMEISVLDRDPPHQETPTQAAIGATLCTVCRSGELEADMLLCDQCNRGFHTHCIGLAHVPNLELWYCHHCLVTKPEHVQKHHIAEMQLAGMKGRRFPRQASKSRVLFTNAPFSEYPPGYFEACDPLFEEVAGELSAEDLC